MYFVLFTLNIRKSVAKDQILELKVCDDLGKSIGGLSIPVSELNHELNLWRAIPQSKSYKGEKNNEKKSESKEKTSPTKPVITVTSNNNEKQTEKKPESSTKSKSVGEKKETSKEIEKNSVATNATPKPPQATTGKGIDKTYIIAGFGTLFFLLALLYSWFF